MDLTAFAAEVGADDPVTCVGSRRLWDVGGLPAAGTREVRAPAGIEEIVADEMTVRCGAGTEVADLAAALAEHGQGVGLPPWGTVGGVLAVGRSGVRRLGDGPVRDALLQVRFVSAEGTVVSAGGPTVKNVSGFDLCRLLVGSLGTLGLLGDVILRTRPKAARSAWFAAQADASTVFAALYRPTSVLWDGTTVWALLEGHPTDVDEQARTAGLREVEGPPPLPTGGRLSWPAGELASLAGEGAGLGPFVAELGVGIVHTTAAVPPRTVDPGVRAVHERLKAEFDPKGRLNPGRSVLPGAP